METRYFVMSGEGPTPAAVIASEPDLPSALWYRGALVAEKIADPLVYMLDPDCPGHLKPLYDELGAPLIRQDLLDVLISAGVDNLQVFPAVVWDPKSGVPHRMYRTFNVVGVVSAADMDQSRVLADGDPENPVPDENTSERPMIDGEFDSLVVDESRASGMLLFRLAESVTTIVVHANVRRRIEESGIEGIEFYGPDEGEN